jgi:omega-6 fatty acid desaturase (delta-12 desaturase)
VVITALSLLVGWRQFLLVQLPITWISGAFGIWLFYIQHQFDDAYWERSDRWDYVQAALAGASYYKMPRILEWFSGNIGYHHIHHLSPRIPNYQLDRCYDENEVFQKFAPTISMGEGLKSMNLALWDERARHMVSFARAARKSMQAPENSDVKARELPTS